MKVVVPPSSYLVENGRLEVLHPGEQQVGEDEEVGLGLEAVPRREAVVELHAEAEDALHVAAHLRLVHLAGLLRARFGGDADSMNMFRWARHTDLKPKLGREKIMHS